MRAERVGRLLLAVAGVLALAGIAVGDSRVQSRILAGSGCLVMIALAVLLLAPQPARTGRRDRTARPVDFPVGYEPVPYRVPQQRVVETAVVAAAEDAAPPETTTRAA